MANIDSRDHDLARIIVSHSIKAKKGDVVVIDAIGFDCAGLAQALVEQVCSVGAAPVLHMIDPENMRKMILTASDDAFVALRKLQLAEIKTAACYIGIRGTSNAFETADIPRKTMDRYNKLLAVPVREARVKGTRWCVMRYPNAAMAQLAQQSREAFANFYYKVCTFDYPSMAKALKPLKQLMEKTDHVLIKGPGTHLEMSIKNIPIIPCTGEYNIPDGECFTAPVKNSVNGTVKFNAPTIWEGAPFEDIHLTFKDGKIINASAANSQQTKKLNEILDQDAGARYVGEFSIAFNPHILHPMRDILFDEKIAGSFHMAMGAAYEQAFNGNKSGLHWDMVCIQRPDYGGGEIHFDGKLIRKDGRFVTKALEPLNFGM